MKLINVMKMVLKAKFNTKSKHTQVRNWLLISLRKQEGLSFLINVERVATDFNNILLFYRIVLFNLI